MQLKAFSIRDAKVEAYSPPTFLASHGHAEREFHKRANDKATDIGQFPADFDLYYMGDYDDQTGKFHSLDTPQHLVKAVDLVSR